MKHFSIILGSFAVLLLLGGGCSMKVAPDKISDEFLEEYCDLYVNKFQTKDLESYGIEVTGNEKIGYYADVASCVAQMRKFEEESESICEQYGQRTGISCDEAREIRKQNYKKNTTYDGCIQTGRGFRCFMFDTSQEHWQGAEASQISSANKNFAECMEKVEYACSDLPKSW